MNNCEYFHSFLLVYQRVDDVPHPVSLWPDSHPGHSPWWIFQPKTERNESLISHTGGLYGTYMSYYMATIWLLYGYYMVTIWLLYYNMVTIWLLSGYYLVTIIITIWLLYVFGFVQIPGRPGLCKFSLDFGSPICERGQSNFPQLGLW